MPRAVLSAGIMVIAIQHIDPWTKQFAARLIKPGTPQRGAIALDLGVSVFVSVLSIAINVVLAVFIGIVLAVLLFVVRMSRSNIRRLYRCDAVRSRRSRDPAELEVLRWVRLGKTNQEIGMILGRSRFTIKTHIQRMLAKTGLDNRTQLSDFAS